MNLTSVIRNRPIYPNCAFDGEFSDSLNDFEFEVSLSGVRGMCWQNDELRELNDKYFARHFGNYIAQRMDSRFLDGGDITQFCDEFKSLYTRWFFQPEGTMTDESNVYIVFGESLERD